MKVKQLIIIGCAALGSFIAAPGVIAADLVSINVTGNIIASPCEVKSNSTNIAVDLGQNIQATSLVRNGDASPWVPIDVDLINCPAATTRVTMLFQGTPDITHPEDMYINTGTATNVAVQLQGVGNEQLGNGKSYNGTIVSNAYTYHLKARAFTQSGSVLPGTISSVVTATFTYQ